MSVLQYILFLAFSYLRIMGVTCYFQSIISSMFVILLCLAIGIGLPVCSAVDDETSQVKRIIE